MNFSTIVTERDGPMVLTAKAGKPAKMADRSRNDCTCRFL